MLGLVMVCGSRKCGWDEWVDAFLVQQNPPIEKTSFYEQGIRSPSPLSFSFFLGTRGTSFLLTHPW